MSPPRSTRTYIPFPCTTLFRSVLALTGLGGVGVAAASDQDTEGPEDAAEFQAFESSQISLTQAIAAAEAETSATAAEAEFEIEDGTAVFEIEIGRAHV